MTPIFLSVPLLDSLLLGHVDRPGLYIYIYIYNIYICMYVLKQRQHTDQTFLFCSSFRLSYSRPPGRTPSKKINFGLTHIKIWCMFVYTQVTTPDNK